MAFLTLVFVVLLMASEAGGREFLLVEEAGVACDALSGCVLPPECVLRVLVVIEGTHVPRLFGVAGLALVAELALMSLLLIVVAMTGDAGRWRLLPVQETGMAAGTLRGGMSALQAVPRVPVVIEDDLLPAPIPVTDRAFLAKFSLVTGLLIVGTMTPDALKRRALELRIAVTLLAAHVHMLARERKFRLAVVEARFLPVALGVTTGAVLAERALVCVVFFVAAIAVRGRVTPLCTGFVAIATRDPGIGVPTAQHEIGQAMIKGLFVQRRDVRLAPLVVGVAFAAFAVADFFDAPMVAGAQFYITHNILVAVETQLRLRRLSETHVAILALGLKVRVPRNDLAGHKRRFHVIRNRVHGQHKAKEEPQDRAPHRQRSPG